MILMHNPVMYWLPRSHLAQCPPTPDAEWNKPQVLNRNDSLIEPAGGLTINYPFVILIQGTSLAVPKPLGMIFGCGLYSRAVYSEKSSPFGQRAKQAWQMILFLGRGVLQMQQVMGLAQKTMG